ncbi:DUF4785 domain-containing protein [Pseudomarimonas arenosa]|uniref:DUF4785 family protein n=1 Tax=Pseudomarimonas arenosa TaxID=2774145 RepID=A0AAW3ZPJ8_9GAMM|nr:DUF4785 domain-containing protein [Pseudomarimonas arenosa]MBD8527109.1 DUF4785 family protein [Pseudomarimonas arenosa]
MKSYVLIGSMLLSASLNAETLSLLPPAQGDLQVHRLVASKAAAVGSLERDAAQFVWALEHDIELQQPSPYQADSREFWAELDAKALAGGYAFYTSAPGALIRVSVSGTTSKSATLPALEIEHGGRLLSDGDGFSAVADRQALKAAGVEFASDTRVFKLDDQLPAGRFVLRAPKAQGGVLVHVNEPQSDLHLQLQAEAGTASAGGRLNVRAKLLEGQQSLSATRIGGLLTAPSGESFEVSFKPDADGYLASVQLPKAAQAGPEQWELHGFVALHGQDVDAVYLRDAKTSFAVAAASARFAGTVSHAKGEGIQLRFDLQAASAGRYELRGTLYGTRDGKLVPFAQAHSAAWLEAGEGQLALDIAKSMLSEAGVHAPFEVRALELNDQSRLATIEHRARGLRIE